MARIKPGDLVTCIHWDPIKEQYVGAPFLGQVTELEGKHYLVKRKDGVVEPLRRREIEFYLRGTGLEGMK